MNIIRFRMNGVQVLSYLGDRRRFFGATRRIPRPKGVPVGLDVRRARVLGVQSIHQRIRREKHRPHERRRPTKHQKSVGKPVSDGGKRDPPEWDIKRREPQPGLILLRVGDPSGHPSRTRFRFRRS